MSGLSGRRCFAPIVVMCAVFAFCNEASAQEGGIEVFAAQTLFEGGTRVTISHIYKRKGSFLSGTNEVIDPQLRLFEENRTVVSIDHGFTPDFAAVWLVPYVDRKMESVAAGTQRATGIGDMAMLGKFRFWKKDWKRSTAQLALIGGVEMPTGKTHASAAGVRLPPGLQPGSGSWDPFIALSGNVSLDLFRFDASVFYKVNTEGAQQFDEGDFLSIQGSAAYRFLFTKYPGPTASASVGLQYRYQDHHKLAGVTVANSGSDELLLRFGIGVHPTPQWDVSVSVDVPIYQDMNGMQLAQDIRLFVGVGVRF